MPNFVFHMNKYDPCLSEDELVQRLMSVPTNLYKYRAWNEFTKDILVNHRMYFSAPEDFNDMCDCLPYLPHDKIIRTPYALLGKNGDKLELQQRIVKVSISEFFKEFCASFRICCLSKSYQSILMWSHYAENHKGMCLVFDKDKDPNFFRHAGSVLYSNVHYGMHFHNLHYANALTVKFEDWQYEEEVRLLTTQDDIVEQGFENSLIPFDPKSLVEIIFGAKAPQEMMNQVRTLCKTNGLAHVKFSQMYLCETPEYKMDKKEIL